MHSSFYKIANQYLPTTKAGWGAITPCSSCWSLSAYGINSMPLKPSKPKPNVHNKAVTKEAEIVFH